MYKSLTSISSSVRTVHAMVDDWLARLRRADVPDFTALEQATGILYRLTSIHKTVLSLEKQSADADRAYLHDLHHGIAALENFMHLVEKHPARARRTPLPELDPRLTEHRTKSARAKKPLNRSNPKSASADRNARERANGMQLRYAVHSFAKQKNTEAAAMPTETNPSATAAPAAPENIVAPANLNPPPATLDSDPDQSSQSCSSCELNPKSEIQNPKFPSASQSSPSCELNPKFPRTISALPNWHNPDHHATLLEGTRATLAEMQNLLSQRLQKFFNDLPEKPEDYMPPAAMHDSIEPLQPPAWWHPLNESSPDRNPAPIPPAPT